MWLAALALILSATAHAGDPQHDWIKRWNEIGDFRFQVIKKLVPSPKAYEAVADLMEHNDYTRYHEIALTQVYDKNSAPWRPLPLEREAVYWWILKLRIEAYEEAIRDHAPMLEKLREDVGIAYRRLARCESLHLFSKLAVMRGQEIAEGSENIGWEIPVPHGRDLVWHFYTGFDPHGVNVDDFKELYQWQTMYRATNPVFQFFGLFTLRIWFVTAAEDDIRLSFLKESAFYVEIDDANGNPLPLPELKRLAENEAQHVQKETQKERER